MSDNLQEQSLTLGDRINYPFILANYLLKFGEAIVQPEGAQSEQQVREAALVLFNSMPDIWIAKDEQFKKDLDNAVVPRKVDLRPLWCGKRIGPKKEEETKEIQPYRLYNAVINVFQRRGYLSKAIYNENIVPTPESLQLEVEEGEANLRSEEVDKLKLIKNLVNQFKRQ
jgi:hypothetical protein